MRRPLLTALLLSLAISCAPLEVPPAESSASRSLAAAGTIELLDAGAAPRAPLRVATEIAAGATLCLDARIETRTHPAQPDVRLDHIPRMRLTLRSLGPDAAPGAPPRSRFRWIGFEYRREAADELSEETAKRVEAATAKMLGAEELTASAEWTPRGVLRALTPRVPEGKGEGDVETAQKQFFVELLSVAKLVFDGLGAPLPEQAIGAGARWRSPGAFTFNSLRVEGTTTWELVSLDRESARIRFRATLSRPPGRAELPNLPPGATVDIRSYEVTETGELTIDRLRSTLKAGWVVLSIAARMKVKQETEEIEGGFDAKTEIALVPD